MPNHHLEGAGAPASDRQFVNDLLNRWDFIGVDDLLEFNPDEYACLIGPLLRRLRAGQDPRQLTAYLDRELAGHFGLDGPAHHTKDFAGKLHTAWSERTD
ncbi:MAG TPA: hypothetical protein VN621_10665 [Arthrobacter sp.]|nr:hypothetical protein [Arthrobacter sp.]